jgi:hypothetical protein
MDERISTEQSLATMPPLPLVALTPQDLAASQAHLKNWCALRLGLERRELADAEQNLVTAKKSKWKSAPFQTRVYSIQKRIRFYEKVQAAVEHGYLVIPDFPIDVFAVRTTAALPQDYVRNYRKDAAEVKDSAVPLGEGRYVSDNAITVSVNETEKRADGTKREFVRYFPTAFQDVEFPVIIAKPYILDATQAARALKIFDRIGLVGPAKKRDPIVVAQIRDPHGTGYDKRYMTFFIAWWFDFSML